LSAELILPAALVVAALIEIAGAVPPELTIGAVPVTPVTVPVLPVNVIPLAAIVVVAVIAPTTSRPVGMVKFLIAN
jgi:hypothetical protein